MRASHKEAAKFAVFSDGSLWNVQKIAETMQNIADEAGCVDKGLTAWYKGTIKSKRLHKANDTGARGCRNAGCGHGTKTNITIE